jgi:hypothetical protein
MPDWLRLEKSISAAIADDPTSEESSLVINDDRYERSI